MKKGLVYKWVFGRGDKKDFSDDNLPKNRFQQFCFVFRSRFGVLVKINLLCALFVLPLCVWDTICGWYVADFIKGMTVAQQMSMLLNLSLLRYGTDAVLCALAAVGLCGAYYTIRRLCWMQSVKAASDFFRGVGNSWKQAAVVGFVYGLSVGVANYLRSFFILTLAEKNDFVWSVAIVLTVVAVVLFTCIALFALFETSLYSVRTSKLFVDGAILTFKRLFRTLLMALVSLTPVVVWFVLPWGFLQIVGMCVVATVGVSYAVTVQTVYCLSVFDEFVNKTQYPDFVAKGLAGASVQKGENVTENPSDGNVDDTKENKAEADANDNVNVNDGTATDIAVKDESEPAVDGQNAENTPKERQ